MSQQTPWILDGNHIDPSQDATGRIQSGALAAAMAADGVLGARAERAAKKAEAEKQAAAEQDMRNAKERLDQNKQDQQTQQDRDDRQAATNPPQLTQGDPQNPPKQDWSYTAADNRAANEWFAAERQPEGTPGREDVLNRAEDHFRKTQPDMMRKYDHYRSQGMNPRQAMFETISIKDPGNKAPSSEAMKNATASQTQTATQSATHQATQNAAKKAATAGAAR